MYVFNFICLWCRFPGYTYPCIKKMYSLLDSKLV